MDSTEALIARLASTVSGAVITPEQAEEYAVARLTEASHPDVRPLAIVRARDVADVRAVVDAARGSGTVLAVRGGGHSAAAHGTVEGGLVLDLSGLRGLSIDPDSRTARAGAGLTAGDYVRAAGEHGLATGFGDTAAVGIAGITLGGGVGLLSRRYGLTIDALLSAEVVTADGRVREVDADREPDLFWALRGGGGNLGVVTAMTFRLDDVSQTTGGPLVLPATPDVLAGFLAAAGRAPRELTTIATLMPCPPVPFVATEHHGSPVLFGTLVHVGPPEEAEQAIAAFRALATPLADLIRPAPYADLLGWEEIPRMTFVSRTNFLERVDEQLAADVIRAVADGPGPTRLVQLRVLGGAISDPAEDATAFGFRDRSMVSYLSCMATGPDTLAEATQWADDLLAALDQGDRAAYVNFLGSPGPVAPADAYPPATWERLRAVKAAYDPGNLFRHNHNIPPATG
ncbi:FAD-binding oxidoreductase [Ornithinimicrobium cavernae]|uniref:FAD-binding oxidoreductase n=1 Tax=Ornithinimicrobium cavernae TaxID=2666047 RepID=UPI0012B17739|nr:FAD-binding oxidoreductase [Ornithinimicrobium cavernae]